jgi:2-polyprenyl-6-methoxyphenol hydroxylase-like FAD-dependent oxidoreductase
MSIHHHVIIIGGGIAGPALALFLKKIGISSTVYEAYPHLDDIGGGLQIAPNGMNILKELGMADRLIEQGAIASKICFHNHRGKMLACIPNGNPEKYGQPTIMIPRATFHRILLEEVERQGIQVNYQKRLKQITETDGKPIAQFEDGTTAEGDFLVGADGVRSRTREVILPNAPKPFYTGLLGVGGFVSASVIPMNLSDPTTVHMTFGPGGFFGYGRCSKTENQEFLWWSNLPREKEMTKTELATLSTEAMRRELLNVHNAWHEPIEAILTNTPTILKIAIHDLATLPTWHHKHIVLIGDAAHAMSPHAGQGVSVALEDAMYLAKLLHQSPGQVETVFAQFEQARRSRVEKINAQARRNGDNKKTQSPISIWFRERMLSLFMSLFGAQSQDWMFNYTIAWKD